MIAVDDAFDPEFLEAVTRRRPAGAYGSDGVWVTSGYADTTIQASVQPASQAQIDLLPEGERGGGAIVAVYTTDDIRSGDGTTTDGDVIEHGGSSYRVGMVQKWPSYNLAMATEFTP